MVQLKCKLQGCDLSPRPREHKMGAEPIYCSREHAVLGFRGLLCDGCNVGLGNFRDSIELLRSAIRYLGGSR